MGDLNAGNKPKIKTKLRKINKEGGTIYERRRQTEKEYKSER
jgi:hypothetical protein